MYDNLKSLVTEITKTVTIDPAPCQLGVIPFLYILLFKCCQLLLTQNKIFKLVQFQFYITSLRWEDYKGLGVGVL